MLTESSFMILCLGLHVHHLLNWCVLVSIFFFFWSKKMLKSPAVSNDMCVSDAQHSLSGPRSTHAGLPSPQVLQSFLTFQDTPRNTASGPFTDQARSPVHRPDPDPDQTALPETLGSPDHPSVAQTSCSSTSITQPAATSSTEPQETHR